MRLLEIASGYTSINQEDDNGSLEGYVVDTAQPQLKNYLTAQGADSDLIDSIANKFSRIAIIRNIWVDDDYRNSGIGSSLLESAINEAFAAGAEAIVLVADLNEDNEQLGKSLDAWYQGWGFKTIGKAGNDPIMLLVAE